MRLAELFGIDPRLIPDPYELRQYVERLLKARPGERVQLPRRWP